MKSSVSNREIWRIAVPIMLGNLAQTIITFTDTAFLGHLGVVELGASMIAGLYYFVFTTMAMGFAVGIQIITARRYGEQNFHRIGIIFQHGAIFIFCLGVILFTVLSVFSGHILQFIIDSDNIYAASMEYIKYRQYGIIIVCFNYLYRSLYIGISDTKVITYSTVIMAVVNIILDYCLIFGNWRFPDMGVGGAALASFMAEVSAFIFFNIYSYLYFRKSDYGMFKIHRMEKDLMKRILKVATPTMIQKLLSFSSWFIFFIFIEKMGETATGISSIVRSVYMIMFIPVIGFASTSNTLTSRIIGEGKSDEVLSTTTKVLYNCLLCCVFLVGFAALFPTQIMSIYTEDSELARIAIPSIYVVCVSTFLQAFGCNYFETISGTGNTRSALFVELGILAIYVIYTWIMTKITTDIQWVWTAEFVYGILIGFASLVYIKFAKWQKKTV